MPHWSVTRHYKFQECRSSANYFSRDSINTFEGPVKPESVLGLVTHKTLEDILMPYINCQINEMYLQTNPQIIGNYCINNWNEIVRGVRSEDVYRIFGNWRDAKKYVTLGLRQLLQNFRNHIIRGVEFELNFEIKPNFIVLGKIDLILNCQSTGNEVLIDWKTSNSLGSNFNNLQIGVYRYVRSQEFESPISCRIGYVSIQRNLMDYATFSDSFYDDIQEIISSDLNLWFDSNTNFTCTCGQCNS